MKLHNNRWISGFDTESLERDLPAVGPLGLVRALTEERRFRPGGPPADQYNVAAHCLLTGLIFLKLRVKYRWEMNYLPYVMTHDLHEALLGDTPNPLKQHIGGRLQEVEREVDRALYKYLGLIQPGPGDDGLEHAIRYCDRLALFLEAAEWRMALEVSWKDIEEGPVKDDLAALGLKEG